MLSSESLPASSLRFGHHALSCDLQRYEASQASTTKEPATCNLQLATLENVRRQLSQLRSLALLQFNVRRDRFRPEPAHDVIESVRRRIHVRIVDLIRVARENDF